MEKRALIAIVLSAAVLFLFTTVMPSLFPSLFPKPAPQTKQAAAPTVAGNAPSNPPLKIRGGGGSYEGGIAAPASALPEKDITVETDFYSAIISTNGGAIKSWRLKKYKDSEERPLEMPVGEGVRPLTVQPEGVSAKDAGELSFTADKDSVSLTGQAEDTLTLSCTTPGGTIIKKLTFKNGSYAVETQIDVTGYKGFTCFLGDGFGTLPAIGGKRGYGFVGPISLIDGVKRKDNPAKVADGTKYQGASGWAGITDKYFMAAAISEGCINETVGRGASNMGLVGLIYPCGGGKGLNFKLYAGPKEYDTLKAMGGGLEQAVDFGWFTFIAKPLFVSLKFFYGLVKNYGWAIIAITIIIKLLFAPLTHKSQKSMKKLQKLGPYMTELKEKHKGDPARMNKEMMELYKKHKVNPMGGCLPMVVQMPVFIALYSVLNNAIELRGAPFGLWLHDLSAKDPYYVLPVLMGLSMLVMQKMTPASMDPKQAKMMMLMPVVMTFMFVNLPSGLVLYFTVSNLLSMAQQLYINKYSGD